MERYETVAKAGSGSYGDVWRCLDKQTGQFVAVKTFKDAHRSDEALRLALREAKLLQVSKHPNIVKLLEAYRSDSGRIYLVLEYVEGNLSQLMKENRKGLPPHVAKRIATQLLQATRFLHKNKVLHRDIKPANILLSSDGDVKLCDFGFARACRPYDNAELTDYVVTRWYRAPEVLVGDEYGTGVDIWAIGCIFAELISGRPLLPGKSHLDQLHLTLKMLGSLTPRQTELMKNNSKLQDLEVPTPEQIVPLEERLASFSPAALQVVKACLHPDPMHRLTASEVLRLPYFSQDSDPQHVRLPAPYPYDVLLAAQSKQQAESLQVYSHDESSAMADVRMITAAYKSHDSASSIKGEPHSFTSFQRQSGAVPAGHQETSSVIDQEQEASRSDGPTSIGSTNSLVAPTPAPPPHHLRGRSMGGAAHSRPRALSTSGLPEDSVLGSDEQGRVPAPSARPPSGGRPQIMGRTLRPSQSGSVASGPSSATSAPPVQAPAGKPSGISHQAAMHVRGLPVIFSGEVQQYGEDVGLDMLQAALHNALNNVDSNDDARSDTTVHSSWLLGGPEAYLASQLNDQCNVDDMLPPEDDISPSHLQHQRSGHMKDLFSPHKFYRSQAGSGMTIQDSRSYSAPRQLSAVRKETTKRPQQVPAGASNHCNNHSNSTLLGSGSIRRRTIAATPQANPGSLPLRAPAITSSLSRSSFARQSLPEATASPLRPTPPPLAHNILLDGTSRAGPSSLPASRMLTPTNSGRSLGPLGSGRNVESNSRLLHSSTGGLADGSDSGEHALCAPGSPQNHSGHQSLHVSSSGGSGLLRGRKFAASHSSLPASEDLCSAAPPVPPTGPPTHSGNMRLLASQLFHAQASSAGVGHAGPPAGSLTITPPPAAPTQVFPSPKSPTTTTTFSPRMSLASQLGKMRERSVHQQQQNQQHQSFSRPLRVSLTGQSNNGSEHEETCSAPGSQIQVDPSMVYNSGRASALQRPSPGVAPAYIDGSEPGMLEIARTIDEGVRPKTAGLMSWKR